MFKANNENVKLKAELGKLNKLLDDEKQKVEDLMFRNEEENINKEDYNKYKEAMEAEKFLRDQRIRDLEAETALQAARGDATAAALRALEEQRSAEAATAAEQHKEELTAAHTLSSELQKLLDEAYALLKEKENEKDSQGKSMSDELARVKTESEKALNETKTKLAIAQTEFDTQISVLSAKLQLAESKLETEKQTLERSNKENSQTILDLNTKLTQLQAAVDDKTLELNKAIAVNKEHEVNLNKEITKLKMELSAKVLDYEQLEDSKRKQETVCKTLQDEITRVKEEYSTKVNEYENLLSEVTLQNEKSKSEILELQQNLSTKIKDYEKLLADSSTNSSSTEKLVNEYKETIHERDKEIIKLKDDYEQATANFNIKHSKIAEEHQKEIDERNTKIEQLLKEIESHKQTLDQNKIEFDKLNLQFNINVDELKILKEENEQLKQLVNKLTQDNNDFKTKISSMELEIGELNRQHNSVLEKCEELQKSKEKVESEYLNLTGQTTDSNEQFNQLSQHLKETERDLQDFKDKHREAVNNYARTEQELKQNLFKLQEESSLEQSQLVRSVNDNIEKLQEAEIKIKAFETQAVEIHNRLRDVQVANDSLMDENTVLKKEIETFKLKEQELSNDYESKCKKLEIDIDRYKEEISLLKAEGATSEVKLMEKVDQLTEAQNDLNYKLEEARKHEDSLQKILENMTMQLNNQKSQHEIEIAHVKTQLSSVTEAANKQKEEETRLKDLLDEKQNMVKDLTLKLEMLDVDLKSNTELITEKDRQITQVNEDLIKSVECRKHLEETFNNAQLEISSLKQKYESLIANSSAEESLLKEHLSQFEALRKEHTVASHEKTSLQAKCNEMLEDFNKLKDEHDKTIKTLHENIQLNDKLKKELQDKENIVKSQSEINKTELNKLKALEEEMVQLKKQVLIKESAMKEKESQITILNETLQSGSNDMQHMVAEAHAKYNKLNEKYKSEVESLNNTIKTLQTQIVSSGKEFEQIKLSQEKIIELQQLLEKSDQDIKQLTNINEAQKLNYEDLNKQLQSQFDEYKKESKRVKHELKAKLKDNEKGLQEYKDKIKTETDKQGELQQKLSDAENRISELSQKLELIVVQQSSDAEKDRKLETLSVELQTSRQSLAEHVKNNEILVNNLKADIERKLKDLKHRDDLLKTLQDEVHTQKARVEIAEREKLIIQNELAKGKDVKDKNDNNAIGILGQGDTASQKTLEEKEMLDGQVSFLNSVIVDMQRKNEQLMARVQALESTSIASEPPLFNGRKSRAVAPRLFCDICDVFDAHDTEDCPRQAAELDAPATPANKRTTPAPRPYCDICEVFGHATENCDEEETF